MRSPSNARNYRRDGSLCLVALLMGLLSLHLYFRMVAVEKTPSSPSQRQIDNGDLLVLRINCGSTEPYTDHQGRLWQADTYYNAGLVTFQPETVIHNTSDPILYQSNRWDEPEVPPLMQYQIPVPRKATYQVTLHFCELEDFFVGQRAFDIWAESHAVKTGLDVLEHVEHRTPLILSAKVRCVDNKFSIRFMAVWHTPFISAIELVELPS